MSRLKLVRVAAFAGAAVLGLLPALGGCGGDDDDATGADSGPAGDAGAADAGLGQIDQVLALLRDPNAQLDDIDARLAEVARTAAWPIHEGDRWLFARRWDGAGDAALTGDWVAWSTTDLPVSRSAGGAHAYVLIDTLAAPTPTGLYKWWSSDEGFVAPPEATSYGYDEFGEYGLVARPSTAHLERFPTLAAPPLASRTVRVRVPAGVPGRTLLLHDGQNVFAPDAPFGGWRADQALADPAFADVLGVAVDNSFARFSEYTHTPDDLGDGARGGRADGYWTLLDDDVLPRVRARFGAQATGSSLAVVGSSLGGLVTLYGAMTDPARAGCSIAMSATLGWGSIGPHTGQTLLERWPVVAGHAAGALVLDAGGGPGSGCVDSDADGVQDDGDDSDNYCVTVQMLGVLRGTGYVDDVDLATAHDVGAGHDEAAWAARLPARLADCARLGWAAP